MITTASIFGPEIFKGSIDGDDDDAQDTQQSTTDSGSDSTIWLWVALTCAGAALSILAFFAMMMKYSENMVKLSFFAAPFTFGTVAILIALDSHGDDIAGGFFIAAAVVSLIAICTYVCFKRFIPFAASTLKTALVAIRMNLGIYFLAFAFLFLVYIWFAVWLLAIVGVFVHASAQEKVPCSDTGYGDTQGQMCEQAPNGFVIFLLILSFYWTQQVIQNVLHCTTAGTVGSWWFTALGDPSFCSRDIVDALYRACTFSFGSICLGSLLISLIQTLESMARNARGRRDAGALLYCIIQCILYCIRNWIEFFTSYAFVYTALYNYDFITSGRNVVALFRHRGWTTFISDRLVFRVLLFCNLVVAGLSGGVAVLVDAAVGPIFVDDNSQDAGSSAVAAFWLGFLLGLVMSNTVLFVIESAVRTVIVCFAESPAEFQECHPDLCDEMKKGWAESYPEVWRQQRAVPLDEATVLV